MAKEDAFKDEDIFFNIWFIYSPFSDLTPTIDREPKKRTFTRQKLFLLSNALY
jgi:hypothetical protein